MQRNCRNNSLKPRSVQWLITIYDQNTTVLHFMQIGSVLLRIFSGGVHCSRVGLYRLCIHYIRAGLWLLFYGDKSGNLLDPLSVDVRDRFQLYQCSWNHSKAHNSLTEKDGFTIAKVVLRHNRGGAGVPLSPQAKELCVGLFLALFSWIFYTKARFILWSLRIPSQRLNLGKVIFTVHVYFLYYICSQHDLEIAWSHETWAEHWLLSHSLEDNHTVPGGSQLAESALAHKTLP